MSTQSPVGRPSATLNPEYFSDAWQRFGSEDFDVVIIGGGSVGAGAALDAATRGLRVALVEARDFAAGTSSRSSKMFHGGLRYLAMFDFALVAESLQERELNMSTLAPHLVTPLKFMFPLTHRVWERVMMFGGFSLYDLMGGAKSVPRQRHYSRRGVLKENPGLKDDAIVGGVRYYDTLVDDARHTMTVIRTAAQYGAVVRPSTEVIGFSRNEHGAITAAELRDSDTGATTTIRAGVFINATGVWSDAIEQLAGEQGPFKVSASKGVHLVVPREVLDASAALTFVTDSSVLFVIPWGNYWIIGTTDTAWEPGLSLPDPAPTATDINYILNEVNKHVRRPIRHEDIVGVYSGLRPLIEGSSDTTSKLSRNHAVARVCDGLVSVAGGKYTTYRIIGKDAVDAAIEHLDSALAADIPASVTDRTPILGADGYHALANHIPALAQRYGLSPEAIEHLLGRYGSLIHEVLAPAADNPTLLDPVAHAPGYLWAEVAYAVSAEGALHLDDIISRRLRATMEYPDRGVAAAAEIAAFVAPLLGWDGDQEAAELQAFTDFIAADLAAQQHTTDAAANAAMTAAAGTRPGAGQAVREQEDADV